MSGLGACPSNGPGRAPGRRAAFRARAAGIAALVAATAACGRKGPPLPPLPGRPAPPAVLQVRQQGAEVWIAFRTPGSNLDGTPARIDAVRLVRRRVPIEDGRPDRRTRLEAGFARSGEIVESWGEAGAAPAGAESDVRDPGALSGWERGFLIAYRVEVRAAGSDRWIPSPPAFLQPVTDVTPPVGLRAEAGEEEIALAWDPPPVVPGAAGGEGGLRYNVYRREDPSGPPARRNPEPLAAREFREPVPPGEARALAYTVRAVLPSAFGVVESADSDPATVAAREPEGIDPPSGLTAVPLPAGIRLAWIPPERGTPAGYRVYRRVAGATEFEPIADLPRPEVMFHDASARPGVRYRYRVVSYSASDPARESLPAEVEAEADTSPGSGDAGEGP